MWAYVALFYRYEGEQLHQNLERTRHLMASQAQLLERQGLPTMPFVLTYLGP